MSTGPSPEKLFGRRQALHAKGHAETKTTYSVSGPMLQTGSSLMTHFLRHDTDKVSVCLHLDNFPMCSQI
jgi:hypothetical protein